MLINELSKITGISIHTIRYYENLGLLTGDVNQDVKTNNYKNYNDGHVERIEIIKEAKETGFTLTEIKTLLSNWYSGSFPKNDQLKFFDSKINEIELKIKQLKQIKKRLLKVKDSIINDRC